MKPWLQILVGLILGVIVGLFLHRQVELLVFVGKGFIDLLKMLVGLIVFSSLVVGMCHIKDLRQLGRIGLRTILFYIATTLIATCFGLGIVYVIRPGMHLHLTLPVGHKGGSQLSLLNFFFSMVPSNPFASFAQGNILQIIVFGILFAFAINLAGEKGRATLTLLESLSEVMAKLTHVIMKLAPYGVFALIATAVGNIGSKIIIPLLWVVGSMFVACLIHVAIIFTLSLRYLAKVNIAPFFKGMKDALVVAITTSSSSATLPVSMECARDHLGLSPDISGFVLSLGSTINMNGTAIGQAVLSIFIAQAYNIELGFISLFVLVFTTLISAIGTAGIPGSGLVMLTIVLNAIGLPVEGIALVAGIDRLRDMMATVVNILGDAVAAVYIAKKENQIDEAKYHRVTWAE